VIFEVLVRRGSGHRRCARSPRTHAGRRGGASSRSCGHCSCCARPSRRRTRRTKTSRDTPAAARTHIDPRHRGGSAGEGSCSPWASTSGSRRGPRGTCRRRRACRATAAGEDQVAPDGSDDQALRPSPSAPKAGSASFAAPGPTSRRDWTRLARMVAENFAPVTSDRKRQVLPRRASCRRRVPAPRPPGFGGAVFRQDQFRLCRHTHEAATTKLGTLARPIRANRHGEAPVSPLKWLQSRPGC